MTRVRNASLWVVLVMSLVVGVAGCGKKKAAVARPQPPVETAQPETVPDAPPLPPAPLPDDRVLTPGGTPDSIGSKNLDELNRNSPLAPVFFGLDKFDLDAAARAVLDASAQVLRQQPTWQVTVEGHCDERGTAEYNISLGERRAIAAKAYLVSLGIAADRLRTVSYGKEFPFDPGHDESAWTKNRRAHFVITAK
jgi:peptidoglycan-associated lipoprotein